MLINIIIIPLTFIMLLAAFYTMIDILVRPLFCIVWDTVKAIKAIKSITRSKVSYGHRTNNTTI